METVTDKFLRYVSFETTSDENSTTHPSNLLEVKLSEQLVKEMKAIGITDAAVDENGYVMGTIPANIDRKVPVLGFIAHVDTSPDASGRDIKPQFIPNYDGTDIPLPGVPGLALRVADFPELLDYKGQTLITTDGTTLLGADDKAGVAEIMYVAEYLMKHPEVKHGTIKIGFTPDEEIGCGTDHFNTELFGAREAYTVDGSKLGEIEYECFNAASAKIESTGRSIHTGDAKNRMLNAVLIGMEFHAQLPASERPEHTEGYEGFYHLGKMEGSVDRAVLRYIIRDHDYDKFQARKEYMENAAEFINAKYKGSAGRDVIKITLKDQYYNMAIPLKDHMELITRAKDAMASLGIEPIVLPIRGGTDGAALTYRGIPCPNLCTGGYNFHGRYEYASVQEVEKSAELLILLAAV